MGSLKVKSFQERDWEAFIGKGMFELFDSLGYSKDGISIKYGVENAYAFHVYEGDVHDAVLNSKSLSATLKLNITVGMDASNNMGTVTENKRLFQTWSIPLMTKSGFVIDGNCFDFITEHSASIGWNLSKNHNDIKLNLVTQRIGTIEFVQQADGMLYLKKKGNSSKIAVTEFLYALGSAAGFYKNYGELALALGNNPLINNLFTGEEPSKADSIAKAIKFLESRDQEINEYNIGTQEERLVNLITKYCNLGSAGVKRYNDLVSFTNRCRGLKLARDMRLSDGTEYKKDMTLDDLMLSKIDNDKAIKSLDIKCYLKEYDSDVSVCFKKYSVDDGSSNLSVEQFLTVINMYTIALDGGPVYVQDVDAWDNRVVTTFSQHFITFVTRKVNKLNKEFANKLKTGGITSDFWTLVNRRFGEHREFEDLMKKKNSKQLVENTNLFQKVSKGGKLTPRNTSSNKQVEAKDVKANGQNRVDPWESSEGKRIGDNLYMSILAGVDGDGFITSYFWEVVNGKKTGETVELNAIDEKGKVIARWDVDLDDFSDEDKVPVRINNIANFAKKSDVQYIDFGPIQGLSYASAANPFTESNMAKRVLMGDKMIGQSERTLGSERALVSTGVDCAMIDDGLIRGEYLLKLCAASNDISVEDLGDEICLDTVSNSHGKAKANSSRVLQFKIKSKDGNAVYTLGYDMIINQKTVKGTVVEYKINTNTDGGLKWNSSDIVFYNGDWDLSTRKVLCAEGDLSNLYGFPVDKHDLSEKGLALGVNVRVLFKNHEGYNFEDAVILRQGFVDTNKLTRVCMHSKKVYLQASSDGEWVTEIEKRSDPGTTVSDKKYFSNKAVRESGDGSYGLPSIGSYLHKGDIIIPIVKRFLNTERKYSTSYMRLDLEEGYVVSSRVGTDSKGKYAEVVLATLKPIRTGDKFVGRHGNKGVIAYICPDEDFPYLCDGSMPDVLLNQMGVPSRMNLGQLQEAAIGEVARLTGMVAIVPPFSGKNSELVQDNISKYQLKEQDVFDGRTGLKFDKKMFCGTMYMLALEHTDISKFSTCGDVGSAINPETNQPREGKGKKYDEMATHATLALNMPNFLQEKFSIHSDDFKGRKNVQNSMNRESTEEEDKTEKIQHPDIVGENKSHQLVLSSFRGMGADIRGCIEDGTARFELLTDKRIDEICGGNSEGLSLSNIDALHDPAVFRPEEIKKDLDAQREKYAYVSLRCKVIMPLIMRSKEILNCFIINKYEKDIRGEWSWLPKKMSQQVIKDLVDRPKSNGLVFELNDEDGSIRDIYLYNDKSKEELASKKDQVLRSFLAVRDMILKYDWQITKSYIRFEEETIKKKVEKSKTKKKKDMAKALNDLRLLKAYKASFESFSSKYSPEELALSKVLVIPEPLRPVDKSASSTSEYCDIDHLYAELYTKGILTVESASSSGTMNGSNYKPNYVTAFTDLMIQLERLTGIWVADLCKDTQGVGNKNRSKSLLDKFLNSTNNDPKGGYLRGDVSRKSVEYASRSAIMSSGISLKYNEFGLPLPVAIDHWGNRFVNIYRELKLDTETNIYSNDLKEILKLIKNNNCVDILDLGIRGMSYEKIPKLKSLIIDKMNKMLSDTPYLLNRAPTLWEYSVGGFTPRVIDSYAMQLYPLSCKRFNADFDGDGMNAIASTTRLGVADIRKFASAEANLINPKDDSMMMAQNQDSVLGMYVLTRDSKKPEDRRFFIVRDVDDLQYLLDSKQYDVDDLCSIQYGGNWYLSTAGRVLFNAKLPKGIGFTNNKFSNPLKISDVNANNFKELCYDLLCNSSTLKDVSKRIYTQIGRDAAAVYDMMMRLGFKYADLSGVTISVFDFDFKLDKDMPLSEIENSDTLDDKSKATLVSLINEINPEDGTLTKQGIIDATQKRVDDLEMYKRLGFISESTRRELAIARWKKCQENVKLLVVHKLKPDSNMYCLIKSGARGDLDNLTQAVGMVGLVKKSDGTLIEQPVTGNLIGGLNFYDAYNLSYSARMSYIFSALETANTGYLGKKFVNCLSKVRVNPKVEDCKKDGHKHEYIKVRLCYDKCTTATENALFGKALSEDNEDFEFINNWATSGYIGEKFLRNATHKHITAIKVKDTNGVESVAKLFYDLDSKYRSWLTGRYANKEWASNLGIRLGDGGVITADTWVDIRNNQIDVIEVRLMFDCDLQDDVCPTCFGYDFESQGKVRAMRRMGIIYAENICELSSQNVLDTHKAKSSEMGSGRSGFQYLESMIEHQKALYSNGWYAKASGFISLHRINNKVEVTISGCSERYMLDEDSLVVEDGDWVEILDPLTYEIPFDNILMHCKNSKMYSYKVQDFKEVPDYLRFKGEITLMMAYCNILGGSGSNVDPRHFELVVKRQTEFITATGLGAGNSDLHPGRKYTRSALKEMGVDVTAGLEDGSLEPNVLGCEGIILNQNSAIHAVCNEGTASRLGLMAFKGMNDDGKNELSKIMTGSNLYDIDLHPEVLPPKILSGNILIDNPEYVRLKDKLKVKDFEKYANPAKSNNNSNRRKKNVEKTVSSLPEIKENKVTKSELAQFDKSKSFNKEEGLA